MNKKRGLVLALLVAAGAGIYFWRGRDGVNPSASQGPLGKPSASLYANAENRPLEISAEAAGLVEPIRVVEVKSRASGEVLRALVETGDRVDAGALLAEIDPRDVQQALAQAEADVEAARVQKEISEGHRKRMQELKSSGSATQQEVEGAVQAAANARAAVVRAETNLQLARVRRQDVTIRAPISGTILQRTVQPGQIITSATSNVSGGTTLFTMADLSQMQVRAKVDETDIGQIGSGQPVAVSVEAYPGRTFEGRVYKVEPQAVVEQNVTLFPVLVRLENRAGLMRPGMNAEVKIQIARKKDALVIPNGAVVPARSVRSSAQALGIPEGEVDALLRPGGASSDAGGGGDATCQALREKMRSAGGPQGMSDEDRAGLRACREARRAQEESATFSPAGDGGLEGRTAFVFVQADGKTQLKKVAIGLSDWEFTEVLDGLEPKSQVVMVSVALLQKQQKETTERIRQRAGGGLFGGGHGGGSGGSAPSGGARGGSGGR